jgi:hypothetical protein
VDKQQQLQPIHASAQQQSSVTSRQIPHTNAGHKRCTTASCSHSQLFDLLNAMLPYNLTYAVVAAAAPAAATALPA